MANSDLFKYISTIQNLSRNDVINNGKREKDDEKWIEHADAGPKIPLFNILIHVGMLT